MPRTAQRCWSKIAAAFVLIGTGMARGTGAWHCAYVPAQAFADPDLSLFNFIHKCCKVKT
ncbi:2430_t:CDS:2 [Gigaspora rosea]|nr:2430_t:CDS:2 [Gigaspora rosea]